MHANVALLKKDIISQINTKDRKIFSDLFARARGELGLADRQLAKRLQVQLPTIERWATGVSAPHPVGIRLVLGDLLGLIEHHGS
jgi:DNA-binding transcriptional regulator YiaG